MEYAIKRELMQIYGEIERQLGALHGPVKGAQAKLAATTSDFEKIISEKCTELSDTQKFRVAENMRIHRISATY